MKRYVALVVAMVVGVPKENPLHAELCKQLLPLLRRTCIGEGIAAALRGVSWRVVAASWADALARQALAGHQARPVPAISSLPPRGPLPRAAPCLPL